METESMEDWTKQADIDADQRCPDKCTLPGCTRVATEAFQFYFYIAFAEDEDGCRVRRLQATPWQYVCQGCSEAFTYEDVARGATTCDWEDMEEKAKTVW